MRNLTICSILLLCACGGSPKPEPMPAKAEPVPRPFVAADCEPIRAHLAEVLRADFQIAMKSCPSEKAATMSTTASILESEGGRAGWKESCVKHEKAGQKIMQGELDCFAAAKSIKGWVDCKFTDTEDSFFGKFDDEFAAEASKLKSECDALGSK